MVHKKIRGKWYLYSKSTGRKLGVFNTLPELKERERQIAYFKHR